MLDTVTLDQIRIFIASADSGSFSAAGRRLNRAQSAVSQAIATLELQLEVQLFERSHRYPRLTKQGKVLLARARAVVEQMDNLKANARSMSQGLEPELAVSVDVMYPMASLTRAVGRCHALFPNTAIRLYVEVLGGVITPVLDGRCRVGIVGSLPVESEELAVEPLLDVVVTCVVAQDHPLAAMDQPITRYVLDQHIELVLTDRTAMARDKRFGVDVAPVWLLADMGAMHAFLLAGFGWGRMPRHMVAEDIACGRLIEIRQGVRTRPQPPMTMHAIYRKELPPGPAGREFIRLLADGLAGTEQA